MHKRFAEKMQRDELLNIMEETKNDIRELFYSARLLQEYSNMHKNITEIENMSHLISTIRDTLYCLLKDLENTIDREKYNIPDVMENLGAGFDLNNVIFEDD